MEAQFCSYALKNSVFLKIEYVIRHLAKRHIRKRGLALQHTIQLAHVSA